MKLPSNLIQYSTGIFGKYMSILVEGRFIYPVMDVYGQIIGLVGHDPFEDNKYLDVKSYGYIPKRSTVYGMEKAKDYITSNNPTFFTEGIGCALYLRSEGYQAYALLGSNIQPDVMRFIKLHKRPVICPDSDKAGNKLQVIADKHNVSTYILPYYLGKDIDDARKVNKQEVLSGLDTFYSE